MQKTASSIDAQDIDRFDRLSEKWWDMNGPMRPLHQFTPVRIDYILRSAWRAGLIRNHIDSEKPLQGLNILDIGCGGGLLAEPLSQLGGRLTAIDASSGAIRAAKAHAKTQDLEIDYLQTSAEELSASPSYKAAFDIVYASEVIEHVTDRDIFIAAVAQLLKPDGLVVLTTINKSLPALFTAKIAAEYILGLIPRGTHQFSQFVRPQTLQAEFARQNILLDDVTGFVPTLTGGFRMSGLTAVNYGICGQFFEHRSAKE